MAYRTFLDEDGIEWRVWEVRPTLAERRVLRERRGSSRPAVERRQSHQPRAVVREDLRDGWLAFRSDVEHRRRAPIPEGWEEMSEEELREILAAAEPGSAPRRLAE